MSVYKTIFITKQFNKKSYTFYTFFVELPNMIKMLILILFNF